VGDDVNAALLDQLADNTRAVSTYVRETEEIDVKVAGLYSKISNPVLANLKLLVSEGVSLNEVYPPQLPDLFHGSQLVVLGRYSGKGHAAITLSGTVGTDIKEFVYELEFPAKTGDEKAFVEDLWARRKVGYLLDQIRVNGEKPELVEEVVALAKKYGIATPYTSYLIVPDAAVPVLSTKPVKPGEVRRDVPAALDGGAGPAMKVNDFIRGVDPKGGEGLGKARGELREKAGKAQGAAPAQQDAQGKREAYREVQRLLGKKNAEALYQVQVNKLGVDLACQTNNLRNQTQLTQTAQRRVGNRNCLDVGGVWIDDGYDK